VAPFAPPPNDELVDLRAAYRSADARELAALAGELASKKKRLLARMDKGTALLRARDIVRVRLLETRDPQWLWKRYVDPAFGCSYRSAVRYIAEARRRPELTEKYGAGLERMTADDLERENAATAAEPDEPEDDADDDAAAPADRQRAPRAWIGAKDCDGPMPQLFPDMAAYRAWAREQPWERCVEPADAPKDVEHLRCRIVLVHPGGEGLMGIDTPDKLQDWIDANPREDGDYEIRIMPAAGNRAASGTASTTGNGAASEPSEGGGIPEDVRNRLLSRGWSADDFAEMTVAEAIDRDAENATKPPPPPKRERHNEGRKAGPKVKLNPEPTQAGRVESLKPYLTIGERTADGKRTVVIDEPAWAALKPTERQNVKTMFGDFLSESLAEVAGALPAPAATPESTAQKETSE